MKIIVLIITILLLISCNTLKSNYNMTSEMNNLHPIEIIYFDKKSEEKIGSFPIRRSYYAEIIEKLESDNPMFIILKYFFDESKEEDNILKTTLEKYNNIITQATTQVKPIHNIVDEEIKKCALQSINLEIEGADNILLPNNNLIEHFNGIGLVDFIIKDNEYVDFPILLKVKDYYIPSLGLLIGIKIIDKKPFINNGKLYLNNRELSLSSNYTLRIDLSVPNSFYKNYSFIDILEGNYEHGVFKDKIIIIFIENEDVRNIKSQYNELHNRAEIVADSINTILKCLE